MRKGLVRRHACRSGGASISCASPVRCALRRSTGGCAAGRSLWTCGGAPSLPARCGHATCSLARQNMYPGKACDPCASCYVTPNSQVRMNLATRLAHVHPQAVKAAVVMILTAHPDRLSLIWRVTGCGGRGGAARWAEVRRGAVQVAHAAGRARARPGRRPGGAHGRGARGAALPVAGGRRARRTAAGGGTARVRMRGSPHHSRSCECRPAAGRFRWRLSCWVERAVVWFTTAGVLPRVISWLVAKVRAPTLHGLLILAWGRLPRSYPFPATCTLEQFLGW